jgi:hypothetical protein
MSRGRNGIFDLYKQTYQEAMGSFSESRGSKWNHIREMAPAQPQVQSQVPQQPYNEQVDEDDEIPSMDHPSRHPAVQAAHAAFVVAHDALADDPTPENLEIFLDQVGALESALRSYVFGEQPGEEEVEGEEVEGEEDEEEVEEDPEEEDEEEESNKFKKIQKRESSPYHKARAQSEGPQTMNDLFSPEDLDVVYDSTQLDPWTIRYGQENLANFSTKEEAEDALELWMSQAQEPMPMDGQEEEYSDFLLPDPPEEIDVSADSVMGGEEQDFRPPTVFTPDRMLESEQNQSHIISYGSMGEVDQYQPEDHKISNSSKSNFSESFSPEDYFNKSSRSILDIESSYEEPEPDYNDPNFFRESKEEIRLIDSDDDDQENVVEIRESQCPSCAGLGCGCCGSTGRVSSEMAEILQESINEHNNRVSEAIGSNHFWSDKNNDVEFFGTFEPEPSDDPMINAYDEIHLARSRR